ncbi:MAG: hypothetical protein ABSF77_19860 [Spirochaetia bacterium]
MEPRDSIDLAKLNTSLDFEAIEKAAKVSLNGLLRLQLNRMAWNMNVVKQRASIDVSVERKILKDLARTCSRCADKLRECLKLDALRSATIEELRVPFDAKELILQCPGDAINERLANWPSRADALGQAGAPTLTLDKTLDAIAIFCEEKAKGRPGRPREEGLRSLILRGLDIYIMAGGKAKAYWDNITGHSQGPFLEMMAELLGQLNVAYTSKDALAEHIEYVLRSYVRKNRKTTTVVMPLGAPKRKSRSISAVKKRH